MSEVVEPKMIRLRFCFGLGTLIIGVFTASVIAGLNALPKITAIHRQQTLFMIHAKYIKFSVGPSHGIE